MLRLFLVSASIALSGLAVKAETGFLFPENPPTKWVIYIHLGARLPSGEYATFKVLQDPLKFCAGQGIADPARCLVAWGNVRNDQSKLQEDEIEHMLDFGVGPQLIRTNKASFCAGTAPPSAPGPGLSCDERWKRLTEELEKQGRAMKEAAESAEQKASGTSGI